MPHILGRREVDRYYQPDYLIIEEDVEYRRWNSEPGKTFTLRETKRIPLTRGERDYVREMGLAR